MLSSFFESLGVGGFRLASPAFLWLLLALPLLAIWLGRRGAGPALRYSSVDTIRHIGARHTSAMGGWTNMLRLLALTLIIFALARPQTGESRTEVEASGIDLVLAIDVSGSMRAMDFRIPGRGEVTRLEAVKNVVARFVRDRPSDRIGIVAFAGEPYLVCPLTLDHDWLLENLKRVRIGIAEDGTAIGSGLAASVNRLREQDAKSRVVVLLTDGVNNSGKINPETAAHTAAALDTKVYTIAAGGEGQARIMQRRDASGRARGHIASVDVDEETLKEIAQITNGKFFRATDIYALGRIYEEIDRLERTTAKIKRYQNYDELFAWALIPGIMLLLTEIGLANTRLRRLP